MNSLLALRHLILVLIESPEEFLLYWLMTAKNDKNLNDLISIEHEIILKSLLLLIVKNVADLFQSSSHKTRKIFLYFMHLKTLRHANEEISKLIQIAQPSIVTGANIFHSFLLALTQIVFFSFLILIEGKKKYKFCF